MSLSKPKKPTDLQMLRLLNERHTKTKLTEGEKTAFRRMLEDLEDGKVATLSPKQRVWVEGRFDALDLEGELPAENLVSSGIVKVPPNLPPPSWESQPKPLKPPGRK